MSCESFSHFAASLTVSSSMIRILAQPAVNINLSAYACYPNTRFQFAFSSIEISI